MATLKREGGRKPTAPSSPNPSSKGKAELPARRSATATALSLPENAGEPISELGSSVIVIHGERKIGKTSMCSKFPDAFFLSFEPGTKGLRVKSVDVRTWRDCVGYIDLLYKNPAYARTVVVDTVDIGYQRCSAAVCERLGVSHPGDADYGKGWAEVEKEFAFQMTRLMQSGRGVVFISHSEPREFLKRTGGSYHKMVPTMSTQARRFILGTADIMAYYGYYGDERYLTLQGSDELDAGHRLEERFLTTSGERVHSVPMGNSSAEAYANFLMAFNNGQKEVCEPELTTGLSEVRKPMGGRKK